jgi:HK97 family phage major capsid protein
MEPDMTLKELREKQQKLVADARAKLEEIKDDTTAERAKEIETEYDAMMAEYDRLDARATREEGLAKRQSNLDAADERRPLGEDRVAPGAGGEQRGENEETAEQRAAAYRKAFVSYLRYGKEGLSADERKVLAKRIDAVRSLVGDAEARAQGISTGAIGAALVAEGFMSELVKSLKMWGPMLDPGVTRRLNTATGASIPWPTMDDTSNEGALIAENTQVSLAEITFGTKVLDAFKYTSGVVLVASELLQDQAIDTEAIVRDAMAERVARIANRHATVGTGSGQPNGIVTASSLGKTAAGATALNFDEIIDLEHSVDPSYRGAPTCRFMFHDETLKAIRKLKDGEGRYIWQPADLKAGLASNIDGYPFSINQAMEPLNASATGKKTVLFGDFNKYVVRMVLQFAIRRLEERYADYDQTGFIGFTRLDGELLDAAAVKHLIQA